MKLFNFNKKKAEKYFQQGVLLHDEGKESDAIEMYKKAVELNPENSDGFYNLGLIYKYRNQWDLSLKYNQRAYELDPESEGACWNLAIAATALRRWEVARRTWKDQGLESEGLGPIQMNLGQAPVRLDPDGNAEVVWATRIDPVRARIENVPRLAPNFRHGDVVLHDGAAVGYRMRGEYKYPVFNVLELFEASNFETSVAEVQITADQDLEELETLFSATQHIFEDWTTNMVVLCKQCSEGVPHEHHDEQAPREWSPERKLGVAVCDGADVMPLFEAWQEKTGARVLTLEGPQISDQPVA